MTQITEITGTGYQGKITYNDLLRAFDDDPHEIFLAYYHHQLPQEALQCLNLSTMEQACQVQATRDLADAVQALASAVDRRWMEGGV